MYRISLEFEIGNWLAALEKLDYNDYVITFSAIIINCLTMVMLDFR